MSRPPRDWYSGNGLRRGPLGVVQQDHTRITHMPEEILRLAHEEYARRHTQSFERIQERGGFSTGEVVLLLADYVDRLKADAERAP